MQINEHFKINNLYFNGQYGFRENYCTTLACTELIDRTIEQLDKGEIPINIFFRYDESFRLYQS